MDCGIVVSECELQSRYNVHFRTNTPDNGGAGGVMVIVVGNGHDDTSTNPGRD